MYFAYEICNYYTKTNFGNYTRIKGIPNKFGMDSQCKM